MKPILEVQNIGKKYRIQHLAGGYLSLRERMLSVFSFERNDVEDFWALKDVSFNVMPGESIGIIGRNGAGKSTLLKVLSKITPPTNGRIISRGRIASLLEVGTGFHPELTGRENIFFNGSLLGMKRKEIEAKFDEIVDFSGVEKFLDTALKHFSSGMQLRLAFAVAAFLEPEILIIDEVLAVGDAEFQKKCLGKMEDVSKSGRTILFVSHNMSAIRSLCPSAIMLDNGALLGSGQTSSIIDQYLNSANQNKAENGSFDLTKNINKKNHSRGIVKATLLRNGYPSDIFFSGEAIKAEFEFKDVVPLDEIVFGIVIKNSDQQPLIGINNLDLGIRLNKKPIARGTLIFEMDSFPLYGNGTYYMDLYFGNSGNNFDIIENALSFKLEANDVFGNGKILDSRINTVHPGVVRMICN
jgi:lipopolysaccharide transport system ATP-binding protein